MQWRAGRIVPQAAPRHHAMLDTKTTGETMTLGQGLMLRLGALAWLAVTLAGPAAAQSADTPKAFAPTGTLRVGVLMVTYFALPD
jgi:hypothetical protein